MNINEINTIWKSRHKAGINTARDTIHYCVLRAVMAKGEDKLAIAKHLIYKAFKPITNVNKLSNGAIPFQVFNTYPNNLPIKMGRPEILGHHFTEVLNEDEMKTFSEILNYLCDGGHKLTRHYSYFFTRQDIFAEYQLVQTAHAALELGNQLTPELVKGLYFTVCGVPTLDDLDQVERVLDSMGLKYVTFREPDIGNEKTSIAVHPVPEHKKGLLKNYGLLKFMNTPQGKEVW